MVKVYALVLSSGAVALVAWILLRTLAVSVANPAFDPEVRLGGWGRRLVAAAVAFGMAGMSAEFSPRRLSWPVGLTLATGAAVVAAWYVGRTDTED